MRQAIKAAFLSGILGAGTGHLFLKRYRRGWFLIMSSLCCLLVIATQAIEQAQIILEKIPTQTEVLDFDEVSTLLTQNFSTEDFFLTNAATMVIMFIWIFGIFDAYKIGKDMDSAEPTS